MILSLKKLNVSRSLSEETLAFTADVYLEGKPVGYARNDGRGGSTLYRPNERTDHETVSLFERELKSLPPKLDEGLDIQARNIEDAIDALANAAERTRLIRSDIKRYTKKGTLFITKDGVVKTASVQGTVVEAGITEQFPGAKIINGMTIDDAVAYCTPFM